MDFLSVVSFVIGVVSFVASIVFFVLGARSERRNQDLLNGINEAIQRWQGEIMASSIELLNSRPEIVGKKISLEDAKAKHQFIEQIGERIKYIVENPADENLGPGQSHNLQVLINCFENSIKSSVPPEVLGELLLARSSAQTQ